MYAVGFRFSGTWTAAKSHVLGCLASDGYTIRTESRGGVLELASPDTKTIVTLMRFDKMDEGELWLLQVSEFF